MYVWWNGGTRRISDVTTRIPPSGALLHSQVIQGGPREMSGMRWEQTRLGLASIWKAWSSSLRRIRFDWKEKTKISHFLYPGVIESVKIILRRHGGQQTCCSTARSMEATKWQLLYSYFSVRRRAWCLSAVRCGARTQQQVKLKGVWSVWTNHRLYE